MNPCLGGKSAFRENSSPHRTFIVTVGEQGSMQKTRPRRPLARVNLTVFPTHSLVGFPLQDYPSYPGFPQSQYSQYYSSSYSPPYVPASSICPSPLSTSTYVLQEASHNIPSQSSESLGGKYHHCPVVIRGCGLSSCMKDELGGGPSCHELATHELASALRYVFLAFLCVWVWGHGVRVFLIAPMF